MASSTQLNLRKRFRFLPRSVVYLSLPRTFMRHVNLQLLAKELNLSIATVSKALRDSHEISAGTKKRVFDHAKALNYTPNPYASSLRRKRSNTIAVVIPEVADSFFSQAIKGIEEVAQSKGYHVLIYLTYESFSKERAILNEFASGRVDGVLMSLSSETSDYAHIEVLNKNDIPVVFFDRVADGLHASKITTDDFESAYHATQHLIEQGCKTIAYLSFSECLSINNQRMQGYKQALKDHKIKTKRSDVIHCGNNPDKNFSLLERMLQKDNRPDGLIASIEKLTTPVYLVCSQLNIHIPQQLKVISFSNLETALILNPSLTTVTQPAFEMGKTAATLLFKSLVKRQPVKSELLVLPSRLIIRNSTASTEISSLVIK